MYANVTILDKKPELTGLTFEKLKKWEDGIYSIVDEEDFSRSRILKIGSILLYLSVDGELEKLEERLWKTYKFIKTDEELSITIE